MFKASNYQVTGYEILDEIHFAMECPSVNKAATRRHLKKVNFNNALDLAVTS